MNYQRILEALHQELLCVNRALGFLTKAGSGNTAADEAGNGPDPELAEVSKALSEGARDRANRREPMLAELREERALLMRAIDTIAKLDERASN